MAGRATRRLSRADWLAALGLTALVLIFLGRALLPGKLLLPLDLITRLWPPWQQGEQAGPVHNPMLYDPVGQIYPIKEFMAGSVRSGELPLWNPYVFTGYPFSYNTQAGMFYPLSAFYYLLPVTAAVDLVIILQMILGALFMLLYLRQIGLRPAAAALGAVIFTFNGLMVVWLEWQAVHAGIIWLPLQLFLAERLAGAMAGEPPAGRAGRPLPWALTLAVAFAIPWLGGHWNWTLYGSLTLALYLAWRLGLAGRLWALARRRPAAGGRLLRPLGYFLIALGLGTALSLIQVLPAFVYLSQTNRGAIPFDVSRGLGLLNRAVVLLIPRFMGSTDDHNWWGPDYSNMLEDAVYAAILPLLLAGMAVVFGRRHRLTWFWAGWGGLSLLWTLGTPAYGLLYALPVFDGLQPGRAAATFLLCLAILAALGSDRLMSRRRPGPGLLKWLVLLGAAGLLAIAAVYGAYYRADLIRTWEYLWPQLLLFLTFLGGSVLLLLARLSGRLGPGAFGLLAVVWVSADLFAFGYGYNTIGDSADLYPPTAATDFLASEGEPYRMVTMIHENVFFFDSSLVVRAPNLSGYEPAVLSRYANYIGAAEGGRQPPFGRWVTLRAGVDSPLLDALNLKYIVRASRPGQGAPPLPGGPIAFEGSGVRFYLNAGALPRAYAVPQAQIVSDEAQALASVVAAGERLHEIVYLELEGQPPPPSLGATAPTDYRIEIADYRLNRVTVHAFMGAPGFLVLADTYYPGWRATVDGAAAPLYRANSLVRAVYLPAGDHQVELVYRPPDFIAGAALSGLSLLVVGAALAASVAAGRRARAAAPAPG
jgi:hypothetical protein